MLRPRVALHRSAFTLIELLVVITIIGILAAVAFPAYDAIIVKGRQTATLSNMRQLGTALILYSQDDDYQLPGRVTTGDRWPKTVVALRAKPSDIYFATP